MAYLFITGKASSGQIPGAPTSARKIEEAEIQFIIMNDAQLAAAKTKMQEWLDRSGQSARGVSFVVIGPTA